MSEDNKVTPLDEANSETGGKKRKEWGRHAEFVLTLIGYAVGLGNIWRFPFQVYGNGGGAFLIPFVLALVLVGIPTFFLEVSMGQFSSKSTIKVWNMTPIARGVGVGMMITNTILGIYYVIIISWILYYFFASMNSNLPWTECDNDWNTKYCLPTEEQAKINDTYWNPAFNESINKIDLKSPTEEYFFRKVLRLSDSINDAGPVVWELALTLLLAWIVVFFVLIKGISSLGKVAYFTSLFPYVLLTVMLVRGATLTGAAKGVEYYLKPDFSKLADSSVWTVATTQIFFSLSVGYGGLTAMASYNGFKNNLVRDSLLVPIADGLTSIYGGFAVFCVLGYMSESKGVPVESVTGGGPGLIFVVYPEALSTMPAAPLWSILFFLMMLCLGFSSMFSIAETTMCALEDEFPQWFNRNKMNNIIFRGAACSVMYLIGLSMITEGGLYLFDLVDHYLSTFPILILVIFECVAVSFLYGFRRFYEDVKMMMGRSANDILNGCNTGCLAFFFFSIVIFSPIVLFVLLIISAIDFVPMKPEWTTAFGIIEVLLCTLPSLIIAIVVIYRTRKRNPLEGSFLKILDLSRKPTADWGPSRNKDRTGRYAPIEQPKSIADSQLSQNLHSKHDYSNEAFQNSDSPI